MEFVKLSGKLSASKGADTDICSCFLRSSCTRDFEVGAPSYQARYLQTCLPVRSCPY